MNIITLNGGWKGTCDGKFDFDAQVPGCTIMDLTENGYLPKDLLVRKKADLVTEYEQCDWIYTKEFFLERLSDRIVLRFERIDTYADIYINGKFLAHTENGNVEHTFDVSQSIIQGKNVLKVHLFSPVKAVENFPKRRGAFTTERLYTRRMQCTYGWDWVARFVTCGIGATELLCYDKNETVVKDVYIFTESVQSGDAYVRIETSFEEVVQKPICFMLFSETKEAVYSETVNVDGDSHAIRVHLENARLWYPVGYGNQPLYTLRIQDDNKILHEETFGIRTVEVVEATDEFGGENYQKCLQIKNPDYDFNREFSSFVLLVNGEKIMCKGANWVPCQPYVMGGKEERITEILELSVEMGLNMIRIWGGGAFECKRFYDECSRLGILVTQDFLMACGRYPEKEDWFINHLQKEAEYACLLIRNQPCVVWYSGDNENAVNGSFEMEDYTGKTAYEQGLKPIVEQLDRERILFASSPYGGDRFASNTTGTTHNTQFLRRLFRYIESKEDLSDYKEELKKYRARFIAEEPIFGATSLSSLKKFMTSEEIFAEDMDMWLYHSKGNPSLDKELMEYMLHFAEGVLGVFENPQDRYFKFRYFQYEWLRVVMEQARREKWFCSGIVFWMLNDCWTAASGWALIDFYNKPKLGYYAFKRCSKSILSSIDYINRKYLFSVSNDSLSAYSVKVILYKVKNGLHEQIEQFDLLCPENANTERAIDVHLEENEMLIADLNCEANNCRSFYKHGNLQIDKIENAIEYYVEDGQVTLVAQKYVHVVELEGEAIFEDNGFCILKGERKTIAFRYLYDSVDKDISVEAYTLSIFKE